MNINDDVSAGYKKLTHVFAVIIGLLATFIMTPAGQAIVAQYPKLSGLVAGVMALAALYRNPKVTAVILAFLAFTVPCRAQTVSPANPPTQHFVINVNAAGYNGAAGTQAVSLIGSAFQLTSDVSVGYLQILNPTDGTQPKYHLGVANYTRQLDAFLPKAVKSKLLIDTTNWLITFQAGGGKVSYLNVNRIAEDFGVFISRPVAPNLQLQCGYQVLHGQGTSVLTRNVTNQPTAGLIFTF